MNVFLILALFLSAPHSSAAGAASYYEKGKSLMDRGMHTEALEFFERAVKEDPKNERAFLQMGFLYAEMKRLESAAKSFQNVVRLNPNSLEAHLRLSELYESQGDYQRALKEIEEVLRINPRHAGGELKRGQLSLARSFQSFLAAMKSGDPVESEAARKKLNRLLNSSPDDPDFQYFLGMLNRQEGYNKAAIQRFTEAAQLSPQLQNRSAAQLAALFDEMDQPEEASRHYGILSEANIEDTKVAFAAGRLRSLLGDFQGAEPFFWRVWRWQPSLDSAIELGKVLGKLNKRNEAVQVYRQLVERDPRPRTRWALGQSLKEQKEYNLALLEFESILDSYPDRAALEREIRAVTKLRLNEALLKHAPETADASSADLQRATTAPAPLLALADGQYALLVDKASQTMLLYIGKAGGLSLVKSYACSTGENDGEKIEKGDKKTPEGIYQFTEILSGKKLPAMYGKMAFPMDYPNPFDRMQGKDGSGIWLHSTDEPLRAFLPRKTRGCIVVNDADIQDLHGIIELHETPIVVYDRLPLASGAEVEEMRLEVDQFLNAWKSSWEKMDLDRYISFYASSFRQKGMNLENWRAYKEKIFANASRVSVGLKPHHIVKHDGYAVATFTQAYQADNYSDIGVKRLFLIREMGQWRIFSEDWRAL